MGLSEHHALDFVQNISREAYEEGYDEGKIHEPSIIGESLGRDGMSFEQWWESKNNR